MPLVATSINDDGKSEALDVRSVDLGALGNSEAGGGEDGDEGGKDVLHGGGRGQGLGDGNGEHKQMGSNGPGKTGTRTTRLIAAGAPGP